MMVGGLSDAKPATPEVQELVDLVSKVPSWGEMRYQNVMGKKLNLN